jgi:hypothetical protein
MRRQGNRIEGRHGRRTEEPEYQLNNEFTHNRETIYAE